MVNECTAHRVASRHLSGLGAWHLPWPSLQHCADQDATPSGAGAEEAARLARLSGAARDRARPAKPGIPEGEL